MFSVTPYKHIQDNETNYSLNQEDSLGLLDSFFLMMMIIITAITVGYDYHLIWFGLICVQSPSFTLIRTDLLPIKYLLNIELDEEQCTALSRYSGLPAQ